MSPGNDDQRGNRNTPLRAVKTLETQNEQGPRLINIIHHTDKEDVSRPQLFHGRTSQSLLEHHSRKGFFLHTQDFVFRTGSLPATAHARTS